MCCSTIGVVTASNRAIKEFAVHVVEFVDAVEDVVELDCRNQLMTCVRRCFVSALGGDVRRELQSFCLFRGRRR